MNLRRSILVLPTFNERENIEKFLRVVRETNPTLAIVVVDDLSPDGTGQIVENIARSDNLLSVIHRKGNKGLGAAYLAGFARALESGFDNILTMDADFSHDPCVIPQLIDALESHADVAIGSRYIPGGAIVGWPLHRHVLSKYGNFYTRFVLGSPRVTARAAIAPTDRPRFQQLTSVRSRAMDMYSSRRSFAASNSGA